MRFHFLRILLSVVFVQILLGTSGCAPGLGRTLSVHRFPDPSSEEKVLPLMTRGEAPLELSVADVVDKRENKAVGVISGRELSAKGEVSLAVRDLLTNEFMKYGAEVGSLDGVPVVGELTEWQVEIDPGFPSSSADALAVLELHVTTRDGQDVYRARYEGSAVTEHPFLSEGKIEETLGFALQQAIEAAIRDEQFRLALMNASLP